MELIKPTEFARYFDHTLLKPEATTDDIRRLVEEAFHYGFYGVCVNPVYVDLAARLVEDILAEYQPESGESDISSNLPDEDFFDMEVVEVSDEEEDEDETIAVVAVIDFPLGSSTAKMKALQTERVVDLGADEVDMVIPIGYLKERNYKMVERHIAEVVRAAGGDERQVVVKVILETGLLTEDEKKIAAAIAAAAGADFVKTSTGFLGKGATVEDVRLLRQVVGPHVGVKASGGIRTAEAAIAMIDAGATRLGTSRTVKIMKEYIALYHGEKPEANGDDEGGY